MRKTGVIVPPLSTRRINEIARDVRSVLFSAMEAQPYVPIDSVYEVLPELIEGFHFEILTEEEMGKDHGRTYPDKKLIQIREDVYDGACMGIGRDRFTMAHELGHLFLHRDVQFARIQPNTSTPIYRNSEWQADKFASSFLIEEAFLRQCSSASEVAEVFGVSRAAAKCRFHN
jgi:Zn-dependent peptidase ImmA (M78 family)